MKKIYIILLEFPWIGKNINWKHRPAWKTYRHYPYEEIFKFIYAQGNMNQDHTEMSSYNQQKFFKPHKIKYQRGHRWVRPHIHFWCTCKLAQPLWKTVWHYLIKANILRACALAILLLGKLLYIYVRWGVQEPPTKWKGNLSNGRKYLQIMYLIRG